MLWRGMYPEALRRVAPPLEAQSPPDQVIQILAIRAVADTHLQRFSEAIHALDEADHLCSISLMPACGAVARARGVLAMERRQPADARRYFENSLSFAQSHGDSFLEASALVNLGDTSIYQEHFDEAVDRSEDAHRAATAIGARDLALVASGNQGWAYYNLGDLNRALDLFLEAEKEADALGDVVDQASWLTNAGYVYMDLHKFTLAEQAFRKAMELDPQSNSKENIYNALRVLARLALQTNDLDKAKAFAEQAFIIAHNNGNRVDELYPLLIEGQVAARHGDAASAERTLRQVERDTICPVFLKWEAEHALARVYEDEKRWGEADREYRAALATFERVRDQVRHEDLQLSFLTNAARIYDDYVHFLVVQGKASEALRWADYDRARTLAEGLGLLSNRTSTGPPPLNAVEVVKRIQGTVLFYWLGEKQSYLWAITSRQIALFPIAPGPEIDAAVQDYRAALAGPQDVLDGLNPSGLTLYRKLIAPARTLLSGKQKIFIIPDGSLNNLNFETLLVGEPKPHYWIEDATITNASSLRLLAGSHSLQNKTGRNLLLVGDSVAPNPKYPELPKAAMQVERVAGHFAPSKRLLLTRERATPAAYLGSKPEQFSYIHFVAHGTASRLIPLESAIVLSKSEAQADFKLYARDIVRHPLRAELVTISACYGAEGREYAGEGLVGLSWAFLKAGAHNVIAALWEATDASTEQLMSKFYDELDKGTAPETALRAAKLSLLRDSSFRNPFYWAPFQLYAGSYRNTDSVPDDHSSSKLPSSRTP